MLRTRRFFSSRPVPTNEAFEKLVGDLEKKGTTLIKHVMGVNSTKSDVEKCPFLKASDPILMRTAIRESNARTYARRVPVVFRKAKGCQLWDQDGNEVTEQYRSLFLFNIASQFLDALGNAGTLSLGHNHPVVVAAIRKFLDDEYPQQLLDLSSPIKDEFITTLFGALPPEFSKVAKIQMCGASGTDVVESALKLAQIATGRHTTICFHGAYHGHTNGSLALMGNLDAKTNIVNLAAGVQVAPYPYTYRCPFGIGKDGHKTMSMYMERMLDDVESGVKKPGAIILECIQGEGGVVPAPVEWLREIRRITEERGIVLIVDEIQTGFFRTGKTFCFEHAGIVPDIVCLSKAVGGGLPMGCIVYNKKLDTWGPGSHAGTFRGNVMGLAAGTAALRWSLENKLGEESARKGIKLQAILEDLHKQYPNIIGDVRGRGLMLGMEIVCPKSKPDHLGARAHAPAIAQDIASGCLRRGALIERGGRHGSVVRFLPPLIITDAQIEKLGQILSDAVKAAAAKNW